MIQSCKIRSLRLGNAGKKRVEYSGYQKEKSLDTGKNRFLPNFVTILGKLWQNRFFEIVPKIGILNFQNYSNGLNFNVWSFFGSLS